MPPKRKTPAAPYTDSTGTAPNKRSRASKPDPKATETNGNGTATFDHSRPEETHGIVQRAFYPPELSNERCAMYNSGELPRPLAVLSTTLSETKSARDSTAIGESVVHWFKRNLRLRDNKGLSLAAAKAKAGGVPLVCVFLVSPQDYQAHLTSAARVDFELRTLEVLRRDLGRLDVPLVVETVEKRRRLPGRLVEMAERWGAKHVFCNVEYEVDELRREESLVKLGLEKGIAFEAVHDDVVVPPGALVTGTGKQYAVYSPWFRSWIKHVHAHPELLKEWEGPGKNPSGARTKFKTLFDSKMPEAPENKKLEPEEKTKLERLWPAGEHEAIARLEKFLGEKIGKYSAMRNFPMANGTACVSVHHSVGTLASRTSVRMARDANNTKKLDGGNEGIRVWISEVAWRDFYKHVLANWPYVCMNKPFKYEYTNIEWEYNTEHFDAWCAGKTGYPIVDAAMRQLNSTGYMHNRCRMIVASFLAKDLLLDWRMGERYFMEHLIDGDFASNNGGWGFSASTGVDPQPYFRIFNPLLQSEKFDAEGDYIRKWVEELRNVEGKAIHDPYGRGAAGEAKKKGYPKQIVEHKFARERALTRYKSGIGRETA
ncbi:photolyase [Mytilinidion resinicola]|uniref:Photolyase n=1 Tax=Mytilinidion resinicola TaxID=574789 RepID=A0A6A6Z581_9PEZI|nr:photolyase [Mytilinidion resinicola]KAF2815889.1 photolyase [Mytilinidion resinicola]